MLFSDGRQAAVRLPETLIFYPAYQVELVSRNKGLILLTFYENKEIENGNR